MPGFLDESKAAGDTNCLCQILTSKAVVNFILFCITLLMLLNSYFIAKVYYEGIKVTYLDIDFIFNAYSTLILVFYPALPYLIMLIGIFGIFAILIGKSKYLSIYAFLLFMAFILNVAMTGPVVVNGVQTIVFMEEKFTELMTDFNIDDGAKASIDKVQREAKCCGYHGPTQWENESILNFNFHLDNVEFALPNSCRIKGREGKYNSYYNKGCRDSINYEVFSVILFFSLASSGLSVLLLLAFICATCLKRKVSKDEIFPVIPRILAGNNLQF